MDRTRNYEAPFVLADGRQFRIQIFRLYAAGSRRAAPPLYLCDLEACDQRGEVYDFQVRFLPSALRELRGVQCPSPFLLQLARQHVLSYLATHRQLVPRSRWGEKIRLDVG